MFYKTLLEYGFLGILGGSIYYMIEMIFRGFSHISMFILGGICMMFFAFQGRAVKWKESLLKQSLRSTIFILCGEFITGLIVNKHLNLQVWDYTDMPFQLFGQICLPFAIIFYCLSILGIMLSGYVLHLVFHEEKPSYKLL
jgi:uncharacterized membrane protein